MKAFLMYRDRDFDPQQLLARRERELGYRNADHNALRLEQLLPWNEAALRQDLGLDILLSAMAVDDKFLFEAAQVALLSGVDNLETILYRQAAFSDCLENAEIVGSMYQLAIAAVAEARKGYWSVFGRYPSGTLHSAVETLQIFVRALKNLRAVADQHAEKFKSEAFSTLFAVLKKELSDEYFAKIQAHLVRLRFRYGVLISANLGKGHKGEDYVLREPHEDKRSWITRLLSEQPPSFSFQLHPRDEAGGRALSELNDRGVNLVANALAQSTDHISSFFQMLRTELAFYVGCLNLHKRLQRMGEPVCLPAPSPSGKRKLSLVGLYDLSLALSMGKKVVGNDLNADNKDMIIVTGANTGGKSTFLRSIGLAQLMMQAGMFVPAESFSSEVCEGLFTHYKREEDATMESGKWDEELSRMSELVDRLGPNSFVLFNESFASTNEREGSEIALHAVRALLKKRVRIVFVTHLYHFAQSAFAQNTGNLVFLRAERLPDGTRPFKLVEAEPLQTSYGEDLYKTIFGSAALAKQANTQRSRPESLGA
jgi:DNA mismatch repair ATPase MutS